MSSDRIVIAFDLYGTLLSTESIANHLAEQLGYEQAEKVAATWRKYQLEYTWRLNSMKQFQSFYDVTRSSLLHALEESSAFLNETSITELMEAYNSLSTFPDVVPALKELLEKKSKFIPVVFSNGTQSMVTTSVRSSPDLGPISSVFEKIITVEKTGKFKPAPEVYYHLAEQCGKRTGLTDMSSVWLISGNPFDITGARAVGMKAIWIDRKGHHSSGFGWSDRLVPPELGPNVVVRNFDEIISVIEE